MATGRGRGRCGAGAGSGSAGTGAAASPARGSGDRESSGVTTVTGTPLGASHVPGSGVSAVSIPGASAGPSQSIGGPSERGADQDSTLGPSPEHDQALARAGHRHVEERRSSSASAAAWAPP